MTLEALIVDSTTKSMLPSATAWYQLVCLPARSTEPKYGLMMISPFVFSLTRSAHLWAPMPQSNAGPTLTCILYSALGLNAWAETVATDRVTSNTTVIARTNLETFIDAS